MKKKLVGIALTSALVLGFMVSGVGAENNKDEKVKAPKYQQEFHVGEKPLKSFKDEETGVIVDVYESFDNEPTTGFTTLSAGWDLVGTDYWTMNGNSQRYWDAMFYSTGGDYMFRVPAHTSDWWTDTFAEASVVLYENDGSGLNDRVASWTVRPQSVSYDYIVRSISGWVDGSNARAEFHTNHGSNYSVSGDILYNIRYYD